MRTYFIFQMKKEFVQLYHDNTSNLFSILRHLYYMKSHEIDYGFHLFSQLTEKIDKDGLNRAIYIQYHDEMVYSKNKEEHVINNLYKDEISVLTIKSSYILVTTNHNYSSFFTIIQSFSDHFFVCDFNYQDYFWLNEIKMLV